LLSPSCLSDILIVLRNFLKVPPIFDFVKKNERFFSLYVSPPSWHFFALPHQEVIYRIIHFCRDQKNEGFNKNAWRLIYQCIRYHPGQIDYFINTVHRE